MMNSSMSNQQAKLRLISELEKFLEQDRVDRLRNPRHKSCRHLLKEPMIIAWIASILGLCVDFILVEVRSSNASKLSWIYHESMIAEGLFLLCLLLFNFWLIDREIDHDNTELRRKLQHSIKQLKSLSWTPQTSVPIPMTRLLSMVRVYRDNKWEYLPYSLLVDGDLIELSFGEISPALVKSVDCDMIIEANQVFRPSLLPMHMKPAEKICNAKKYYFQVQNMPIMDNLKAMFSNRKPRPKTVFRNQVETMYQMLWRKWVPVFILLSLISNIIRLALSTDPWTMWFEFLVIQQIYVIIPLLPVTTFVLWIVLRTLGNAKIILLFDQLQQSTTPFDDTAEVDEFDEEAPPPTKEIEFGRALLLGKLFKELLHMEEPHSGTLFETLSTITVICSVDRVGTITNPVPQVEQMLVFDPDSMDPSVLDLNHIDTDAATGLFEDKDWKSHLPTLKPVGLNLLLNSKTHNPMPGQEMHHRNLQNWAPIRLASALQACQCHIAREIGFKPEQLVRKFKLLLETVMAAPYDDQSKKNLRDDSLIIPSLTSSIHYNLENSSKMVVSDGIASFLLNFCSDYWDGRQLVDMDDILKQRIVDFCLNAQENDLETVAYSYSPVVSEPEEEIKQVTEGSRLPLIFVGSNAEIKDPLLDNMYQMINNQSFLAITTVGYQPKTDVREFIEDLRLAGIRFVYFSQKGQRESKAFAERLGLETDWNTCILLSSPDDPNAANADGYLEPHDIKAKLPRGIENIRPHLTNVDDIPLHVSLFADCLPSSIEEMLKIYQENGEVVCCFGSSLNRFNSGMFCTADISVAIDPFPLKQYKAWNLGASLFSLPVSLTMNHSSSPYTLSQVIKEARNFMIRITQGFVLLVGSQLALACTVLLSNLLLIPPVFEGYQLLWISIFINPLLMLPFAVSSNNNSDVMKLMPTKNRNHAVDVARLLKYYLIRFIPISIVTISIYIILLLRYSPGNSVWKFTDQQWFIKDTEYQNAVTFSQAIASFVYVYCNSLMSGTFLNRTASIFDLWAYKSKSWLLTLILCIALQCIFIMGFLFVNPFKLANLGWILAVVLTCPLILLPFQEIAKRQDRKQYIRFQKRSKLEFNTKLGCYSPV